MTKQHLILAVKEPEYVERLAAYIRHSSLGESWQLTAFTNLSAFRNYIDAGYSMDLIAVQPSFLGELGAEMEGAPIAVLVTRYGQCPGHREVLQYQPIPQLIGALSAAQASFGEHNGGDGRPSAAAAVVAVYSASGGIGKTAVARQIAQQAGVRGSRVFYLNLEQWNAASLWLGDEGGEDFAQMLYTLQAQPDRASLRLTELRKRHAVMKFDYFAPCSNADERLSLNMEQGGLLLSTIAECGEYDVVVVDLDSRVDPLHRAVFQYCAHLVWLVSKDVVVQRKTELALRYLEQKWGRLFQELKRKFRFVQMRAASLDSTATANDPFPMRLDGVIPAVTELAEGLAGADGVVSPAFRGAVEALLDRLVIVEGGRGGG